MRHEARVVAGELHRVAVEAVQAERFGIDAEPVEAEIRIYAVLFEQLVEDGSEL